MGDGEERTEQPTERRKREARRKGTVTKSNDVIGALAFMAILMTLPNVIHNGFLGLLSGLRNAFRQISVEPSLANAGKVTAAIALPILPSLALLIGVAMTVGLASNFAQVGFHASPEAMKPSFNKLNPMNGFKRMFGKPALFDAFKGIVKLGLFSYMVYTSIRDHWTEIGNIWQLTPLGSLSLIGQVAKSILTRVGMVWMVLAVADYMFQKKQTDKQLKMTKQEVRQEMKDAETSPELKGHRMRQARKFSKMRTAQAVREADVIITNPTHFAIAIQYNASESHAPVVVAKGVDALALRIREIAKEASVPIVENKPLARALYKQCEVGDFVPRDLFQGVAEVLAYVYKTVKRVRR
jgi:flagellar biosynthesis protein FlhB